MKDLFGRRELSRKKSDNSSLLQLPTMKREQKNLRCLRCNGLFPQEEVKLPNGAYYCPGCLQFGRVDTNQVFVTAKQKHRQPSEVKFTWQGELSSLQQEGSQKVLESVEGNQNLLLWAVTGSGKTEMLFQEIYQALTQGKRVGIATPRIDVCRELYPRFKQVFPETEILLLYGDSEEKYRYAPFTICTTHQLLRFYRAFDLLIIDEIDAFPYTNDPKLGFAAKNALKKTNSLIYLTATPSEKLLKETKGNFQLHKIPARYHGRPLPEPRLIWWNNWNVKARKGKHLRPLLQTIQRLVSKNHVLIFCPSIELMKQLLPHLQRAFKDYRIQAVSSQEENREETVQQMRQQEVDILLTTTILERGVTFEKVSVLVLGANHQVFNQATLVQIAGRVDRKGEYSQGEVVFFYDEMTRDIRKACREIKEMNRLARRGGFLDEV